MAYIVYCKMTGERLAEYKNKETLKGLNLDKCYFVESKPMSNIIQERVGVDGRVSSGDIPHGNNIAINDSKPRKNNSVQGASKPSDSSDYTRNLAISLLTLS